MTLFNFDSTSAAVKFGTLKIAVFVNDLDFMFPAAECKGFILFKFEDSAEGREYCLLLYAGKLPSSGAEEVSGLLPKCKACLRPQSRGVTSPKRMPSRAILWRKQSSSPRLLLGPYQNVILMEELMFTYLYFFCRPFLPTCFM